MNEYLLYALLVIAAIALIGTLYWLIKVRPIYQSLKREIRKKVETVRETNADLEQANILFRMKREVRRIQYVPPEMVSRAKELSDIIAKGIEELSKRTFPSVEDAEWLKNHDEIYQLGDTGRGFLGLAQSWSDHAYHWLWRGLRALVVFNRDRILASLFPHPRGSLTKLRELDEEWKKLVGYQRELLKLLQKLPGSAEFLDTKEKARLKKKAEMRRRQQAIASIEQAKERLERAMKYVRLGHAEKSPEIGELPVTGGSANLTLSMLEQYWEREMGKVNDMIQRAVDSAEIVDYITDMLLPNLEGLFEEKAKEVALVEFSAREVQDLLAKLGQTKDLVIKTPGVLETAFLALAKEIPQLWANANWGEFDARLKSVQDGLDAGRSFAHELEEWLEDIESFLARMAGVKAKEDRLKEVYGLRVSVSPDWEKIVANFETEALNLWSEARFDELDTYLKAVENPLRQHQFKVTNRLTEADREAGVSAPSAEDYFQAKLAPLPASTDQRPPETSSRRHQQEEPQRKLTGKRVKYVTAFGLEVEVDESMVEHYKRMDEKQRSGF